MKPKLHSAPPPPKHAGPRLETATPAPHLVSLVAPTSFAAEQYRILRHTIELRQRESGLRVVAVTSPGGGEGKTTTCLNLAGALAQGRDTRVLVFEADLRRPSVLRQLGLPGGGRGLVDAVLDALPLADVVRTCTDLNLHVVPAGAPPLAPYEVLKSARMGELLQEARAAYDYVVVDTPPVVPCPDYRLLEKHVDGTLLVVAADRTPRQVTDAAESLVEADKALGLVFNGDSGRGTRYQDHYYAMDPPAARPRSGQWFGSRR